MNVFVGQIYIKPGIVFFFSHIFQKWLSEKLTRQIKPSEFFIESYSEDFDLIFRLSAKAEISEPEIKGPTVFEKDKDVEFTIFLPHNGNQTKEPNDHKQPLELLLDSIVAVLKTLKIDTSQLENKSSEIVEHIISDRSMFKN